MAKTTGKNAVISINGTVYACLTDISINGRSNIVDLEASITGGTGTVAMYRLRGAEAWSVATVIILDSGASTVPNAWDVNTSISSGGGLIAYPEGDNSGDLKYTWAQAYISTHVVTSGPGSFMTLAIRAVCNGVPTIATV